MKNPTKHSAPAFKRIRLGGAEPLHVVSLEAMMTRFMIGDDSDEVEQATLLYLYLAHAGTAYGYYLTYGRGALVLPLVDGRPLGSLSADQYQELKQKRLLDTAYIKPANSFQSTDPDAVEIKAAMDSYDPENEVVLVVWPPGRPAFVAVAGKNISISPRQLYEQDIAA